MRVFLALVGFAAILIVATVATDVIAQTGTGETQARISARPLGDGRIEFAFQIEVDSSDFVGDGLDAPSASWSERILPRGRNFPSEPTSDGWLSSRPSALVGEVETRIRARRLEGGRTEFALQQKSDGETWGENVLPASRYLTPSHRTSHVDRWLNSSVVTLSTNVVIPEVVVPAGVPIIAEAVLEYAELDGYTFNGSEPSFYYRVDQDPLYETYYTWIVKVAKTDDDLYDTIRLQVSCHGEVFAVFLWEDSLPYHPSYERVRISYRFDSGDIITEDWIHYPDSDDGFFPNDIEAFAELMRSSDKLVIRAAFFSRTITATFTGVSKMFRTRVQPNIEYCGHY